jgi:phenylacetate-CoA ligase
VTTLFEIIGKIPLYQTLYGNHLTKDLSFKDLNILPELTKTQVAKNFPSNWMTDELQKAIKENNYELMTTSGTSSERTQLIRPKLWWDGEEKRLYQYLKKIKLSQKYTEMRSKAILTTAICSNTLCYKETPSYEKRIVNGILHLNITPDPNLWTKEDIQRISDEIDRFKPQCFQADPIYLAIYIKKLRKFNLNSPSWSPFLLVLSYEYCQKRSLKIIRSLWDIPTFIIYGITETGFIFHQCPEGKFHSISDSLHFLFTPLAHLQNIYELKITSFRNPFMPFVNYNTKDLFLITRENQKCSCGCEGIVVDQIMGRTKDLTLIANEKFITVGEIDELLNKVESNILTYILDFSFNKKIIFKYTTFDDSPLSPVVQTSISNTLSELYQKTYSLELLHEMEIKPSPSGKFEIIKKRDSNG